jgi:histidine ammonia-lyase
MRELVPQGSNVENEYDVQDPYSLRCIPQVHGPSLEGILSSKEAIEVEMNSGSDNPLVFIDREPRIVSGGNFHGEYPAKQLDILAMYTHEIGSMSFMRAKRMMNPFKSLGMPGFLTKNGGKCSGLMTWENVAASLVSENKVLCHPSSVDSAETCADKEDHVSMGGFAARKAITISENVTKIIAIELMTACHALQHRFAEAQEKGTEFDISHPGLKEVYKQVKHISPMLINDDRYTVPEYNKILEYLQSG